MSTPTRPKRALRKSVHPDLGMAGISKYNEAAGADKVIIVEAAIERAVLADEIVGAGKLVKVAAAGTYDLKLLGRGFDATKDYQKGDIVSQAGRVYMANFKVRPKAFDVSEWRDMAPAVIAGIPNGANAVISLGRWHNTISVAGFLVQDDTEIPFISTKR